MTSVDSQVSIVRSAPAGSEVYGVAVGASGAVPRQLGLSRKALEANGFTGKVGQTLIVPTKNALTVIAVGIGDAPSLNDLRNASASLVRAAGSRRAIATNLAEVGGHDPQAAAQVVAEGALLAAYKYVGLKSGEKTTQPLVLSLVVPKNDDKAAQTGVARGLITSRAANRAREWANTPPSHLRARDLADQAVALAADFGLAVEVFNADELAVLGCGGILGVNAGSVEPPRMVKLTYSPRNPKAHLALVGKGVMYDSGGISLKPSNPMHALMKMDMSGAAAVLSTMTALRDLGCRNKVTAWLMCTDNMPSGSALKLGDVLKMRNGKTVEVHNTDAEGRLILADGLSLAVEANPDAIVDIATLTGAAMAALGEDIAAVLGSDQKLVDQLNAAAQIVDEPIWQLPLAKDRYRKLLDSGAADMKNVGGSYAGAITASIFLSEFVGNVPWAHLDIAGPMNAGSDSGWMSKGATAFGTRLLIELATTFTPVA